MNQLKLFGMRLRAVKKAGGITQEEAAEKAGLNPKYLGQIERGEKRPSFDAIISLARALQVSPSLLFQFDREVSDERTLRRNIDALLRFCSGEQLRRVRRVIKALVEPRGLFPQRSLLPRQFGFRQRNVTPDELLIRGVLG